MRVKTCKKNSQERSFCWKRIYRLFKISAVQIHQKITYKNSQEALFTSLASIFQTPFSLSADSNYVVTTLAFRVLLNRYPILCVYKYRYLRV